MSVNDYHHASQTGMGDLSKPETGLGIAEYNRKRYYSKSSDYKAQLQNTKRMSAAGEELGNGLGTLIAWVFPYFLLLFVTIALSSAVGGLLGFGEQFSKFPVWYINASIFGGIVVAIALKKLFPGAMMWIKTAGFFLAAAYFYFA